MNMYQKRQERQENKKNETDEDKKTNINWYPGHMVKTKREIQDNIKLIDIIIEILDARIPISSRNPDIQEFTKLKKHIVVLNKSDLANEEENKKWINLYNSKGIKCVLINSLTGQGFNKVIDTIYELNQDKKEKLATQGVINRSIKVMVVGIPNVGKSSFINKIVNKNIAKVGNRPGVTRNNQWIRINKDILLLDTPGILWPKFEENIGRNLCFAGCIKDEIMDIETISYLLVDNLLKNNKERLFSRYKIDITFEYNETMEVIDKIAKNRGCILPGNRIDYTKVGNMILDEFQTGKIGKISLERIENINDKEDL